MKINKTGCIIERQSEDQLFGLLYPSETLIKINISKWKFND